MCEWKSKTIPENGFFSNPSCGRRVTADRDLNKKVSKSVDLLKNLRQTRENLSRQCKEIHFAFILSGASINAYADRSSPLR